MRAVSRLVAKLARKLEVTGGWIWYCRDCSYRAFRVHDEKWARTMAINHTVSCQHTVNMMKLK